MKNFIFIVFTLFINTTLFAYEFAYRVTEDTIGYSEYRGLHTTQIKKNTIIRRNNKECYNVFWSIAPEDSDSHLLTVQDESEQYSNGFNVSAAYLELANCSTKLPDSILTFTKAGLVKKAISSFALEVLYSNDPNTLGQYDFLYLENPAWVADCLDWNNWFFAGITNLGLTLCNLWDSINFVDITKISDTVYEYESFVIGKPDNDYDESYWSIFHSINIDGNSPQTQIIRLTIDGDYLHIYNKSKNKAITTLVYVDDSVMTGLVQLFKQGSCDLTKVKWPRHADGFCDYDGKRAEKPATNVAQYKRMYVSEKLKLRAGEDTSSQVLTVMPQYTEVRILELGKEETIDGIHSNWVKVDVQLNPRGNTGEPLRPSMTGWCFGGYLE